MCICGHFCQSFDKMLKLVSGNFWKMVYNFKKNLLMVVGNPPPRTVGVGRKKAPCCTPPGGVMWIKNKLGYSYFFVSACFLSQEGLIIFDFVILKMFSSLDFITQKYSEMQLSHSLTVTFFLHTAKSFTSNTFSIILS